MARIVHVMTDIHGRADLLERALEHIGDGELFVLGDLVDRGPESRQVVTRLMLRPNTRVIRGNHEDLLLEGGIDWHMNGGLAALDSYPGCEVYEEHRDWIRSLPYFIETEHHIFVHAGLMPGYPLRLQEPAWLTWIRDRFLRAGPDPAWGGKHVVHGHTPYHATKRASEPEFLPDRTNLDTGAYHTGVLTVGVFDLDVPGPPRRALEVTVDTVGSYIPRLDEGTRVIVPPKLITSLDDDF